MTRLTPPLARLVGAFQQLPGIGAKTAQRLALYIVQEDRRIADELAQALLSAKKDVLFCSTCGNLSAQDPCEICKDSARDHETLCIVSSTKDVLAFEKTHEYRGQYHVLQGLISPMDGIGPEQLKIKELLTRLQSSSQDYKEIIIALSPSIEGEATTLYLSKLLRPLEIPLSRIAYGLPMGGDIEYADEVTLARALEGRREL